MNLGSDFLNQLPKELKARIAKAVTDGYDLRTQLPHDPSHDISKIIAAASLRQDQEIIEKLLEQIEVHLADPAKTIAGIEQLHQDFFP
ncbi:hypothetical protein HGA34_00430 [Candidatus Falkowbacteria bacterium]|nr:hypothetical protein [Candidatus Falkowbacteria bacterium]